MTHAALPPEMKKEKGIEPGGISRENAFKVKEEM
jgi:hypothetical protein